MKVRLVLFLMLTSSSAVAADCPTAATLLSESQQSGSSLSAQESKLREVLEKCPDLAEGQFQLGNTLLKAGRASEARKSFEKAIALKRDSLFLVALGNASLELKDEGAAEDAFEDALKADTNNAKAMQAMSVLSFRQGKKNRAEELLRKAIQVNPEDASLFYNLGIVLADSGRNEEAAESFRAASERRSPYPEALIQLGSALLRTAQYEQAERAFRSASLHDPTSALPKMGLGTIPTHSRVSRRR
jgi:superkiller protein 3